MESFDTSFDKQFERIIDNLPFPVAIDVFDTKSDKVVFLNRQFIQTFGYTLDDFETLDQWATLAYPDKAYRLQVIGQWVNDVHTAFETKSVLETREVEVITKEGQTRQVLINGTPWGRAVIAAFVDITQQREVEAELRSVRYALERTAYELTENIPVGTYTMVQPADGGMAKFRFMSTRFLELTGLSREEAWEDPMKGFACVHPEDFDHWVELNVQAFSTRTRFYGETRLLINGEIRWITAESQPRILSDGSVVWEGVLTDITSRKLAEQALIEAKTKAEQLEKIKSEFLMQMSHEIRTPLTTVLGIADLLAKDTSLSSPHLQKVEQLKDAGKFLLSIVNDILDLSKIEAGQLAIDMLPFSLDDVLKQVRELSETVTNTNLTFTVRGPLIRLPLLKGDSRRLSQILINLTGNALKFTESGTVDVSVDVLGLQSNSVSLRFNVRDTGIGIAQENIPTLFKPFEQAETGIARRYGGSGLGLPIALQLVELMQGSIGVHSELSQGSHFWCDVHFEYAEAGADVLAVSPRNPTPPPKQFSSGQLKSKKILVVDDSASIRSLVGEFLALEQADVEFAENGQEALEKLRARGTEFDAVLMDIQMPVMDGLTATRAIKHELGLTNLPIFAMTAGLLSDQQSRAYAAGMTQVISKPIHVEHMIEMILHSLRIDSNESFPYIEGIDREDALKTMENDPKRFTRLLLAFKEEFHLTADEILSLLLLRNSAQIDSESARREARRLAHSVRGAAAQIGAREIARIAEKLETELSLEGTDVKPLVEDLDTKINRLVYAIGKRSVN